MAPAIVPCAAAVAAACPPADHQVGPPLDIDTEPDELAALAAELAADDVLGPVEALSQALALNDDLLTFAAVWNVDAALAGHPGVDDPRPMVHMACRE